MQYNGIPVKAIRGATTVPLDSEAEIINATIELLEAIIEQNELQSSEIVSIIFTATPDITGAFPAKAGRSIGLDNVPLICCSELDIEGMLPMCIRVMAHAWMPESEAVHVYLRDAVRLREDLAQ